jgi:signal transduction histidine kinase
MNVAPYVILYIIPAAVSAALALYSWQRRQAQAAMPFSLLMAAVVFWSSCHALSAASSSLDAILFWALLQYGGIVLIGPLWLMFALSYTGSWPQMTPKRRLALLLPALVAFAAVLSNGWHHLWWPTVGVDVTRPFGSLSITRGPLFWLHSAYTYGCVLLGFVLFARSLFSSPATYRRQAMLVAGGALFPMLGNLAHLLGLRTSAVDDPTPFLFAASGVAMFYAALRYQFLDLMPLAQREIFASLPDGVIVLDQRGIVMAINDLAPRLLSAQASQWIGRPLLELVAGSPLEIDLRAILAPPIQLTTRNTSYESADGLCAIELRVRPLVAADAQATRRGEGVLTSEEERRVNVLLSSALRPASPGGPNGTLLLLRDQTTRAQAERALEQRLSELTTINQLARAANAALQTEDIVRAITRELMRMLPGDRVSIGLLSNGQRATSDANGAMLYLAIDEARDSVPTLEGQALTSEVIAPLLDMLHSGQSQVVNADDPLLEGTLGQAMLRREGLRTVVVVPLRSQDTTLGVLFIGHADTRQVAPDELRLFETIGALITDAITRTQLYEQAQSASRAKSAFLAMISHELRTPLTSIIGFTDMLDQGIFGELAERVVEPIGHIRRSGYTLLRMINDILDFSKMEAGHFTVERYPVDLPMVIRAVADAMQPQIQSRGLELNIDLDDDTPLVYANTERLEQVITNLLSNAVKFTDAGSITVRVRHTSERIHLSVVDTGIGIAPEQQGALFQEFRQLGDQAVRRYPGTGLGLAISRRLVEMMGGTLTVESAPGVGSTFLCELPVVAEALHERVAAFD